MGKLLDEIQKVALVTGASRGIGKAITEALVSSGYFVLGTYNRSSVSQLKKRYPKSIKFLKVDFKSKSQLTSFIKKINEYNFDLVVNNAGMFEGENFEHYDRNIWYDTFQVNLNAVFEICLSLQDNINSGGCIINMASTDGYQGSFASMAYSASKAALLNFTKSLANNYGPMGVRVNSISPGWINTSMATDASYEAASLSPLGRNGRPEEVASSVLWLCSESAKFVTGADIRIDGGYTNVDYIMRKESES